MYPWDRQMPQSSPIRIVISKIIINVKFPCRLFLQSRSSQRHVKRNQIKLNPKQNSYMLEQEISMLRSRDGDKIQIFVKLVSSKGVTFTAGIIQLDATKFPGNFSPFRINLVKALDPQSYCQCRELSCPQIGVSTSQFHPLLYPQLQEANQTNNQQSRYKARQLQLQLQNTKTTFQLLKLSNSKQQGSINLTRQMRKYQQLIEVAKIKEKQNLHRIEKLEAEQHQNSLTIQKQKEIIHIMEVAQSTLTEQKTQLKIQVKSQQNDLEEKRSKIRQLQGEKLQLVMNSVTTEKEVSFLKQRIFEYIHKSYRTVQKIVRQDERSHSSIRPKGSFYNSNLQQNEHQDESYKVQQSSNNYFSKEEVPWQQQESSAFKQPPNSSLSSLPINEFSISNINSKQRQEVLLQNNQLFVKSSFSFNKPPLSSSLKHISDDVKVQCRRMEKLFDRYHSKTQREINQLKFYFKGVQRQNHQLQANQYSLINHLEELQGGLETELATREHRDQALNSAHQTINRMQVKIVESDKTIQQLLHTLAQLQEQKQALQTELHQNNYIHARKQQQFLNLVNGRQPTSSSTFTMSPKVHKRGKRSVVESDHLECKQEAISLKENIRNLQLQLAHIYRQCEELQLSQERTQNELRQCQFALRFRERTISLKQSLYFDENPTETQQQQQEFTKLLDQ